MRYLNTILTLIAILLIIIILQNNSTVKSHADNGITNVNIKQIGGYNVYDKILKVEVK